MVRNLPEKKFKVPRRRDFEKISKITVNSVKRGRGRGHVKINKPLGTALVKGGKYFHSFPPNKRKNSIGTSKEEDV